MALVKEKVGVNGGARRKCGRLISLQERSERQKHACVVGVRGV